MRSRIITVPRDQNAEKLLDYDKVQSEQLIELFLSEDNFIFLFKNNIINLINIVANANVDDYEDECISDKDKQLEVIHAIEQIKINFDREKLILLDKLINLFKEAISRNTGIYFFF